MSLKKWVFVPLLGENSEVGQDLVEGSALQRNLDAGEFVITSEVTPPASTNVEDLLAMVRPLRGLVDAVNVTDGAGARVHLDPLVAAYALKRAGIEPILQITCRDRNRLALQSEMLGAAALGIHNLLALTGDSPTVGDQPEAKPVFDLDSSGLIATAGRMRDRLELPSGKKISGTARFFLGVADAPVDPTPDWAPAGLIRKIQAGAQFAQSQFCMDIPLLRRYLTRLTECGVPSEFRYIVGLSPLRSARSARWMRNTLGGTIIPDWIIERLDQASDPTAEGIRICVELMSELCHIPGVAGVHLMAPSNAAAIPPTIAAFNSALQEG